MILRPRQKLFVERSVGALREHKNTLSIAPTGFGKTLVSAAILKELIEGKGRKGAFLAHRDELTAQNCLKFAKVAPNIRTSVVDANQKNWRGDVTFAMVPTLGRNLDTMPRLDVLGIDEAHHVAASTYRRIIDRVKSDNPDCLIFGVTATPTRGDKVSLKEVFSNVADQVRIGELIQSGHLVPPRTFVIDTGISEKLMSIRKTGGEYDMAEAAHVMNKQPLNDAVVEKWKELARDRPTVVFCSTVAHAEDVAQAFNAGGVSAVVINGSMTSAERKTALKGFEQGKYTVVVNVMVLTEGWDYQPVSCVVLLRPSSYKSTMIQMIGRGLRTVDPELFPGVVKTDCLVLDFGTATFMHGNLEQDVDFDGDRLESRERKAPVKTCPGCDGEIPLGCIECPLCGYIWEREEAAPEIISDFVMTEIDLLKKSSFVWSDLFSDDTALMAQGFNAWAGIFFLSGYWYAIGGGKGQKTRLLSVGERMIGLAAANDWLNTNETDDSAHKTRRWISRPPTEKQIPYLPEALRLDPNMTRYKASVLMTFKFNKETITRLIYGAAEGRAA